MSKKLTFKEYLDSKQTLREAVNNTPHRVATYQVNRYCKLVIGESKECKQQINLKPKQKILVEWQYDNLENPTIIGINFEGVKDIDSQEQFASYWKGEKLQKWLLRNTREEN